MDSIPCPCLVGDRCLGGERCAAVRGVAAAGLAGIALEASNALILDQAELVAEANDLGIWIYGFTNEEVSRSEKS